ncbi:MAG: 2-C-methyl-D-erythritol 4-phosphate cytidylyltransferase [Lachnospiraceae bacterium]|nr:2-C-methyl-D-erythritol 4-phosphate cytidylyltransferase [Lachnospiraceae bacterium]
MILGALVAGGTGTRMKQNMPKQFLTIGGEPILVRTLRVFLRAEQVDGILIGVPSDWISHTEELVCSALKSEGSSKRVVVTAGGSSRNETLRCLTEAAEREFGATDSDIFLTHDAVRPFVTPKMIAANVTAMENAQAASTAIPACDTILLSMEGRTVDSVPKRSMAYQAQTPQTARLGIFRSILEGLSESDQSAATDLCGLCERKGIKAVLVPGDASNIKITGPLDLALAEAILKEQG